MRCAIAATEVAREARCSTLRRLPPQAAEAAAASVALRKGSLLLKYCRHGKPHVCFVQLSPDERELQWVSGAGKPRTLPLTSVRSVLAGQQTAVFRRADGCWSSSSWRLLT